MPVTHLTETVLHLTCSHCTQIHTGTHIINLGNLTVFVIAVLEIARNSLGEEGSSTAWQPVGRNIVSAATDEVVTVNYYYYSCHHPIIHHQLW